MTIAEFINKVGFKVDEQSVKNVNKTINSIKSTATKVLGTIGIGISFVAMNALVEEFGKVNQSIDYMTDGLEESLDVQNKILESANNSRMAYKEVANYATKLSQSNSTLFPLEDAAKFIELTTKIGKAAGYDDSIISTMNNSLQKVVASGEMNSSLLQQLNEKAPALINQIASGLGVTKEQLTQMAATGKLSADTIKTAMLNSTDEINKAFGSVKMTVSDAMKVIRNQWGLWLEQTDKTFNITQKISETMVKGFNAFLGVLTKVRNGVVWLSEKLGGMHNLLKLILIVAGSLFAVFSFSKITSGLSSIVKLLQTMNLHTMAVVAAIVILALLVEDFINFMQGNDSMLGELLKKAGIDCDGVRNTILKTWESIKKIFSIIAGGVKIVVNALKVPFEMLKAFWEKWGDEIMGALGTAFDWISTKVGKFFEWLSQNEKAREILEAIGVAIGVVAAAIGVAAAAIGIWNVVSAIAAVVTGIFGGAMAILTSPITLVVLAIVALIAIIYLLIKHWDKVKEAAGKAWEWIKGIFKGAATWFKENVIDPIVDFFKGLWDGIVSIFSTVGNWFKEKFTEAWEGIKAVFSAVGEFFQGVWDTIVSIFTKIGTTIGDTIGNAFKTVVNAILEFAENRINGFINAINKAIGIINKIPGVNISELKPLELPRLANGGFVKANKPQQVIIGDNPNEGEIVSPISAMKATMLEALRAFTSDSKHFDFNTLKAILTDTLRTLTSASKPMNSSRDTLRGNSVNRNVTQNIEINNTFEGDKAGQQKSASAMDKAANDCTSELARALQYT